MEGFDPESWETYATALLGASGVLVGLIYVSLSINVERLLKSPWLFRRAGGAILQLAVVVVATALVLVPGQTALALGWQLILVGLGGMILVAWMMLRRRSEVDPKFRRLGDEAAVSGIVLMALYAICGISLTIGVGGGMYWLVPATLLCLGRALLDSWVLLVEIYR